VFFYDFQFLAADIYLRLAFPETKDADIRMHGLTWAIHDTPQNRDLNIRVNILAIFLDGIRKSDYIDQRPGTCWTRYDIDTSMKQSQRF
jgi:hypothetical protein